MANHQTRFKYPKKTPVLPRQNAGHSEDGALTITSPVSTTQLETLRMGLNIAIDNEKRPHGLAQAAKTACQKLIGDFGAKPIEDRNFKALGEAFSKQNVRSALHDVYEANFDPSMFSSTTAMDGFTDVIAGKAVQFIAQQVSEKGGAAAR